MFSGIFTAMVTPFVNGVCDTEAFSRCVRLQRESGVAGVVIGGTTGEAPTLTSEEYQELLRIAVAESGPNLKILAGVGHYSTTQAIASAKLAESFGVDGLMIVSPYYNRPSQEGLYCHFKAIHDATNTPIMLYNHPGRTGVDIGDDLLKRLFLLERVLSIKDATGDIVRLLDMKATRFRGKTSLTGVDRIMLPFLSAGGDGVVSVISNAYPKEVNALYRAVKNGDIKKASALHQELYPVLVALDSDINPTPIKMLLSLMGLCSEEVRLPLVKTTSEVEAQLTSSMLTQKVFCDE